MQRVASSTRGSGNAFVGQASRDIAEIVKEQAPVLANRAVSGAKERIATDPIAAMKRL